MDTQESGERKMKIGIPICFCILFTVSNAFAGDIQLHGKTVVHFTTVEEGVAALTKRDRFTKSLSRFDLQSRLQTERDVTIDDLMEFVSSQVVKWEEADIAKLTTVIDSVRHQLAELSLPFPKVVLLVKTTGKEEGNAAYCRGQAVVLPEKVLKRPPESLERLVIHELFHILSSNNPRLRTELYSIIGFKPCNEIELPQSLAPRKITNPDAPTIDHYIKLKGAKGEVVATPILYASVNQYDAKKGGSFFRYLLFRMLVIEEKNGKWQPVSKNGKPVVINPTKTPSYFEQIGRNTNYVIHPDEILADNFVHLVKKTEKLATPEIVKAMEKKLRK
ncbi:MAG: hypothetical protein IH991_24795 [Planctomycetes bacterium]|nr:hypothetical protein [Planctomycetota bacterium]